MTGNIFFDAAICFFIVMGIISTLQGLWGYLTATARKMGNTYVVLTVQNQQESVEGIIRGLVWQHLSFKNGGGLPQVVVVDLGSQDETPDILERLARDYSFVYVTDKDGYVDWIKNPHC